MTEVISVKFKSMGKTYFFAPNGNTVATGDSVVIETAKGLEMAECVYGNHMVEDTSVVQTVYSKGQCQSLSVDGSISRNTYMACIPGDNQS